IFEALDTLLKGTNLEVVLAPDRDILIIRQKLSQNLKAQLETVTGTVTDAQSGETLPGVNVMVKGTNTGTSTEEKGYYELNVPSLQDTLIFTFVGYERQEVPIAGRTEINIELAPKTVEGEEMVVVAFGEQEKEDVIGAVTSVSSDDLQKASSGGNLTTSLAGQMAGVISYQRSGEPGQDNADFFIRGVTTFGYKQDPLILIDDIEVSSTELARLEPDDIASFSILKDATATSLYGSRAANGVILIKTKQGYQGEPTISVRMENSISMPTQEINLADPITYMQLHNEAALTRDPLAILPYSDRKIDNTRSNVDSYMYPSTNWREALFKDYAMNQRINLNVRGGGSVARYYVAGSVDQDNGVLKVDNRNNFNNNINLKNYNLRSNVDISLTNTTDIAVKLSGDFDDYQGPLEGGAEIYEMVMRTDPVRFPPVYPKDSEHQYVDHPMFGNYEEGGTYMLNPYAEMVRGYRHYNRSVMSAQFEAEQDFSFLTEGLKLSGMLNIRREAFSEVSRSYDPFWYSASSFDQATGNYQINLLNQGEGTEYLSYNPGSETVVSSFYMQSKLNYQNSFLSKHDISGLLVFTARNEVASNASDLQSSLPRRNVNLAGRATYTYDSRYYAEFNFGYNGSERFHRDFRFGFFPSVGVAWNVSNEPFWEPIAAKVNKLKFRATYGLSGNDAIGSLSDRFLYLSNVNMNDASRGAVFGRDNGYYREGMSLSRYSNPAITWERVKKLNLGLELGLFERMNIQADVFREQRDNILMDRVAIPPSMGLSDTPQANVGEAVSRGFDFSMDYSQFFGNTWWLQGRANFTYATSEYLTYEEYEYDQEWWKSREGYAIQQRWGYIAESLFVDDEEAANAPRQNFGEYGGGDIKYRDVNRDGEITELDQVPIGYPTTPEIVYGFGFSAGYKNLDISAFFQGSARSSFWINVGATTPFIGDQQLLQAYAEDHWSEDDRDIYALWPRLSSSSIGTDNNSQTSTWFMRDGSFVRLKQLEIGYTLPQKFLQQFYIDDLRIYANGSNLLTWSKFDLWDVEMAGEGLGYPIQRVFNLGIHVSF
ncbi:MAG TPA: TonB-dependent receptor, partial [Fodinibius sp.]|nr:TonB-dependent receptor [Fodinibius sp.]